MQIIEQSLIAKNPEKKSEDGLVVSPDFIAVIDGSTSKSTYRHSMFRSNGRQAMRLVSRYLHKAPKQMSCHEFLRGVTAYIRKHYSKSRLQQFAEHPEDRLTCSAIVYSRLQRQIWMIGDCQCMVDGRLYENPKPAEEANAIRRAEVIHRLLAEGKETVESLRRHDKGRDAIIGAIIDSCQGQNKTFSVVDGTDTALHCVRVISTQGAHEIVLATDGYPHLMPTLDESERELKRIIEEDPLMTGRYKATKAVMEGNLSFDDRCYVRFSP